MKTPRDRSKKKALVKMTLVAGIRLNPKVPEFPGTSGSQTASILHEDLDVFLHAVL